MRYAKKRIYTWSNHIAYSVGLIASDGCLQKDGRHIDLTSKDLDQLKCFQIAIGRDLKISTKLNGSGKQSFRIQFSDVAYYDFLQSANLTTNKSHTIAELKVPSQYYADFLRGVFDGDGTVYGYTDTRWKNSFMYYIGICSASKAFLKYIHSMNQKIVGVSGGSFRHSSKAMTLAYAKKDSLLLYKAMYENDSFCYLKRKRAKLERFIKQDDNGTIIQSLREW